MSHNYTLPIYTIGLDGLEKTGELTLPFVKGSKGATEQEGVTSQDLIKAVLNYLGAVNQGEMKTEETTNAINNLQQAHLWLEQRRKDRERRGVLNTNQK